MTVDESKLREVIADVRALRDGTVSNAPGYSTIVERLNEIERKLGGLLPPIGGKFNISLDTVIKPR